MADVSRYFCDDFSYPEIRCSRSPLIMELRGRRATLLAGVDYVTIFEHPTFSGASMHVSQDYGALVSIGWNDKISSYKGRNSETGRFWTDWFSSGTSWSFCCNSWVPSLGSSTTASAPWNEPDLPGVDTVVVAFQDGKAIPVADTRGISVTTSRIQ